MCNYKNYNIEYIPIKFVPSQNKQSNKNQNRFLYGAIGHSVMDESRAGFKTDATKMENDKKDEISSDEYWNKLHGEIDDCAVTTSRLVEQILNMRGINYTYLINFMISDMSKSFHIFTVEASAMMVETASLLSTMRFQYDKDVVLGETIATDEKQGKEN